MTDETELTAKQARGQRIRECREWLKSTWPQAFSEPPKPLTVGVHKQIREVAREAGFSGITVRAAFAGWCNRLSYHVAVADGSHRVNLDGSQAEAITAEQQQHARGKILEDRKRAKQQKRNGRRKPAPKATAPATTGKRPTLSLKARHRESKSVQRL
ncbi:hypothetical protein M911_01615 [Ectothiorhodospira haloalkaliphila]|uniref:ProQ/FinO domain-containing protein n=1 Tax=Ectothiorhodospira haloalkaliphila TaxID=421628 RepID=W8KN17_9GAMM|nr:ProQ/FinO family protein [Ectothiorhodospira haloalkaliphila]AHK80563.1 hypothetical protein M911_01615 [Ectothiorhodospira haloalkaliphila]